MPRATQYSLTDKGRQALEDWRDLPEKHISVLDEIDLGLDTLLDKEVLEILERKGLIREEERPIEALGEEVPEGLRRLFGIYARIAEGKPVGGDEVEELRKGLEEKVAEAVPVHSGHSEHLEKAWRGLRDAKGESRKEKVIAIDSAVQAIHKLDYHPAILRLLDRLAN